MVNLIFKYLLESSICLILFMVTYRILIANKTNFIWMRFYLLISLVLSLILPLIIIPIKWSVKLIPTETFLMQTRQTATTVVNSDQNLIQVNSGISILNTILFFAFVVYILGIVYKSYLLIKNLMKLNGLIKKSTKVKEETYWIIYIKTEMPAFSFLNYIFINYDYKDLSFAELEVIKKHEMVHVKQYHTLDILFIELVYVIFWFNPIVNYLKKTLKEIHEYIVDERIAGHGENKKAYAQLLLTLASDTKVFDFAASFTGEHIKRRILMIAKPRTSPKYKLTFFVLVPLTAMLLLSFSYLKNPKANSKTQNEFTSIQLELKKYCGVYYPSKKDITFGQKPIEITINNNKLFANGTIELDFQSDSRFFYSDNSGRSIEFVLNSKKEVTGCGIVKSVTKGDSDYLLLEGEYSKGKTSK